MAEPSTTKKAVDLEAFRAASELIATKAEVKKAIAEAQLAGSGVEYATTEEVLALFQDSDSGDAETP